MNEIQLYNRLNEQIDAVERLGKMWARSGMFRCSREEQGPTIVTMCMSMGITPTEFMATYDLIDGVPRKKALACLADFRKRGGRHKWLSAAEDKEKAVGEFSYEGQTYKVTFTLDDARQQGLVKPNSNWAKTPSNMLRARVITTAIGMLAPEIVAGTDAEEDSMIPAATALNLSSLPAPPTPAQISAPSTLSVSSDEKAESEMGLAPIRKTVELEPVRQNKSAPNLPPIPKGVSPSGPAIKEIKWPAALDPIEPDEEKMLNSAAARVSQEEPMPPPAEIGPEPPSTEPAPAAQQLAFSPAPATRERQQLDPVVVDQMGRIFEGHFLDVANWMIRQAWIPPSPKPLNTEAHAALHLQTTLPFLTKPRAKKVLAQKMAFMRAVEEINP